MLSFVTPRKIDNPVTCDETPDSVLWLYGIEELHLFGKLFQIKVAGFYPAGAGLSRSARLPRPPLLGHELHYLYEP